MHEKKILYKLNHLISYLLIILQLFISISLSTQTDLTINFEKKEIISLKNNQIETKPYTLKINENTSLIAKQYGLTAEELKLINIYRTFSKPFEQLSLGDVIDVPKKNITI